MTTETVATRIAAYTEKTEARSYLDAEQKRQLIALASARIRKLAEHDGKTVEFSSGLDTIARQNHGPRVRAQVIRARWDMGVLYFDCSAKRVDRSHQGGIVTDLFTVRAQDTITITITEGETLEGGRHAAQ